MDITTNNNLNYFLAFLIIIGLIFIGIISYKYFKKIKFKFSKNYKARAFLTQNEKDCFLHLRSSFPEYHICPQVSMGAVLDPNINTSSSKDRKTYTILRHQIQCKVIDFVFLNKNLEVEFVIELDDKSHDSKLDKDTIRDKNLADANIPTIRFRRTNGQFMTREEILKLLGHKK